jgi:O-antigen biosynthesis protein
MESKPYVSVVVCVNRNPQIFNTCLKSLQEQSYPTDSFEVVLVDATKNGDAEKLFLDHGVKIVRAQSISRGAMLNVGTDASKGEIVAYTDADCMLEPDWLSKLVDGFSDSAVIGVGGNVLMGGKPCRDLVAEGKTDGKGYLIFDSNIVPRKGPVRIAHFLGANCAFYKSILKQEGCYSETPPDIGCEDVDLCIRLMSKGYKLKFVNANLHHPPRTTKSRLTNGLRDGRALCFLLKRHKSDQMKPTYFRLIKNLVWEKGSILMLFGFIDEAGKRDLFKGN